MDLSLWFIDNRLKKNLNTKGTDKQCMIANTSAIWQHAAHTTDQPTSPSCSTGAVKKKSLSLIEKYWRIFWKKFRRKGQQAENDKTERVTGLRRRTREEIAKWNQMTALRFQTGGRHQTSPASLRGNSQWVGNCSNQFWTGQKQKSVSWEHLVTNSDRWNWFYAIQNSRYIPCA